VDSLDLSTLKKLGIQRIEIYESNRIVEECKKIIEIDPGNKKVMRILSCFPLAHEDFLCLMKASNKYVGVTGDSSISEAISLTDILPFYEVRMHKRNFNHAILLLIKHHLGEQHLLVEYFQLMNEIPREDLPGNCKPKEPIAKALRIGELLQNSELLNGWKVLCEIICSEYNAYTILPGIVNRAALFHKHPLLITHEQEFLNALINREILEKAPGKALKEFEAVIQKTIKDEAGV
jgi:hypothetical protein